MTGPNHRKEKATSTPPWAVKQSSNRGCVTMTLGIGYHLCPFPHLTFPHYRKPLWVTYLEKRISTLQSGWAQGSKRAESAPEVDAGEQGARSQQDGSLQQQEDRSRARRDRAPSFQRYKRNPYTRASSPNVPMAEMLSK